MKPPFCRDAPITVACPKISAPDLDGRPNDQKWAKAARLDRLVRHDGTEPSSRTIVWIGRDDAYLFVAARCEEKNTAALQLGGAYLRDVTSRDHIEICVDPFHDHTRYFRFYAGPFAQTDSGRGSCEVGFREDPGSRWLHHSETPDFLLYFRYASTIEDGKAWNLEIAIPFETFGDGIEAPQPGAVWGINIARLTRRPVYHGEPTHTTCLEPLPSAAESSFLSSIADHSPVNPLCYADMVFDENPVRLLEADFGVPHFGINQSVFRFQGPSESGLVLKTCVRPKRAGRIIDAGADFPLDREGRCGVAWHANPRCDTNVLELSLLDPVTRRRRWHASYSFGWEAGNFPLAWLHHSETDAATPDPDPADPDFLVKKAAFIAARQHRFHRSNTALGAASDFCLESSDGSVRFDLMQPDCLDAIARYVHGLYENDTDRLLGMLLFAAQPAIMRAHTAYDPGASSRLETLSLLRFGSGYCGHMSRVMATLLNRMEIGNTGTFHRARCFGIGGHGLVLVEHRGSHAVLDPKHPALFFRLDNSDLATIDEIRREPEILRRAYPLNMPALMTFDLSHIPHAPPDQLTGCGFIHPENAPTRA